MPRNAPQTEFGPILGRGEVMAAATARVWASERIPYYLRERHSWVSGLQLLPL